jgi:putative restriction endonuclease
VNWLITDRIDLAGKRFFVQTTLWPLENDKLTRIREVYAQKCPHLKSQLDQLLPSYQAGVGGILPEEIIDSPSLLEGAVRRITVNAYERNPEARQRCIAAHGTTCCICGFRFGAVYGPEAEGYIHVHHLRELSRAGGVREVDPIKDLRPVCPNCHAVLHLDGECRSIREVKKLVNDNSA